MHFNLIEKVPKTAVFENIFIFESIKNNKYCR
jgi:hypothetical protein